MRSLLARYGGIALIVSVALNLFLVGLLAGGWVLHDRGDRFGRFPGAGIRFARQDLAPDSRALVRKLWEERREAARPQWLKMREARRKVRELATADTVDPAALEAAFADLRQRSIALQAMTHELMVKIAESLPAAERKKLFARRIRPGDRDRRDRRDAPPRDRPPPGPPPGNPPR
jgi:uncharacterized membrane protein